MHPSKQVAYLIQNPVRVSVTSEPFLGDATHNHVKIIHFSRFGIRPLNFENIPRVQYVWLRIDGVRVANFNYVQSDLFTALGT